MEKKKTHEKFIQELESKFRETYTVLEKYKSSAYKILVKHNECGYTWKITPANLINGNGKCPQCSKLKRYTTETFSQLVKEITNSEYEVIGNYINTRIKIKMKHVKCGYEWEIAPQDFKNNGARCPRCQKRERYTDEDFKKKVEELSYGEIIPLDHYKNNYTKIRFQHIVCGAIFKEQPSRIINELKQCPECNHPLSKGERKIANYLNEINIKYETQYTFKDCFYINLLKFDFGILENNNIIALIEYDGEQHFKPIEWFGGENGFKGIQERDRIKNEYCKKNNIPLLRIPYWEFDNVEYIINDFLLIKIN